GFETRLWNNKVNLDFTYYTKTTKDALLSQPIAPSAGAPATPNFGTTSSVLKNIASVQNTGLEAQITATLVDRRMLGWDLNLSMSHNSNKILKIPGGNGTCSATVTTACDSVGTGATRQIRGNPINGQYYTPFTFNDANGNGIIEPTEVTVGLLMPDGSL